MRHALLIAEFLASPWALMPERLAILSRVLARIHAGTPMDAATAANVEAAAAARADRRTSAAQAGATGGAIAVLPMYGIFAQRPVSGIDAVSGPGVMSTMQFTQSLRAAVADAAVGGILIDIDSPGGSVFGVDELAAEIMQARDAKPVYGVANSLCASAAYWAGSACTQLFAAPGSQTGSIGVYLAHEDWSKALEAEGVTVSFIQAGKFKTEGTSVAPLTDDAREYMQSTVDAYYSAFTKAVGKGRGVPVGQVRDGMGQGRVMGAADAKAAGMVDDVDTFDGVIGRLAKAMKKSGASSGSRSLAAASRRDLDFLSA